MKNQTAPATPTARPPRKGVRVTRTAPAKAAALQKPRLTRRPRRGKKDLDRLNEHPLNQHALRLLPRWALEPEPGQLHLLTLASPARFATGAERDLLAKMQDEWPPAEVVEYFSRVEAFDDLFLAQQKPLEAAQVILAAVDLLTPEAQPTSGTSED